MSLRIVFLLFIVYSVMGWIIEIIDCIIENKKIVNRGFLIGPYCPIYGCGAIFMTLFLERYKGDIAVLFLMAIFMCSILEYFTSLFMELIFKTRWWDYSKYKYNINGRICLETMIPFGILGCLMIYIFNPFFLCILHVLPKLLLTIISVIILIVFIIDNIVSFSIIINLKGIAKNIKKDYTEEITSKVREVLMTKSILYRRIAKAFPNMQSKLKKIKIKS